MSCSWGYRSRQTGDSDTGHDLSVLRGVFSKDLFTYFLPSYLRMKSGPSTTVSSGEDNNHLGSDSVGVSQDLSFLFESVDVFCLSLHGPRSVRSVPGFHEAQ